MAQQLKNEMASQPITTIASSRNEDHFISDYGWSKNGTPLDHNLIDGLSNDDLWVLVRRFNKQVFHIKHTPEVPRNGLDFNIAEDAEFSPNKLRSQLERLYMGLLTNILASVKHIARLRSWREPRRTGLLCFLYFTAWTYDWLITLLLAISGAFMVSSRVRYLLFPPAPIAIVDYNTGGITKPSAGVLGSTDTATGAPEAFKGEALENEASNFVTSLVGISMNVFVVKDNEGEPNPEDPIPIPEPISLATKIAVLKDKASGVDKPSQDKTRVPMQKEMWIKVRPMLAILCLMSDTWERLANLVSPTPPFNAIMYRSRLIFLVVVVLSGSRIITAYIMLQSLTFGFGLVLFALPLVPIIRRYLNALYSDWHNYVRLDRTLFKGVPTNIQLAITILRRSERNRTPIPPPPMSLKSPSEQPVKFTREIFDASGGDIPLNATKDEIAHAIGHDENMVNDAGGPDTELSKSSGNETKGTKLHSVIKHAAKAVARTSIGVNKVMAKGGSTHAKARLGVVPHTAENQEYGPVRFEARFEGIEGHVKVITNAALPYVSFSKESFGPHLKYDLDETHNHWSIPITNIVELKKSPGYGFKSKLMMGWAMDREVKDGIEIIDKSGITRVLTAVPFRDGLFNRLCAIGNQKWTSL